MKVPHLELHMVAERTHDLPGEWVQNSEQASSIAHHLIGDRPVEHLIAILVDGRGHVTGVCTLAQGGLHGCAVTARDILRTVLTSQASAFVLAHNHPSGDPLPSKEDEVFTAKVKEAAELVGVPLLDHVVVTRDGSFRRVSTEE